VLGLNRMRRSGHLGREEIEVIGPVIEELSGQGWTCAGRYPPTPLCPAVLRSVDVMSPCTTIRGSVVKHEGFGNAVNVTLGLPIVRTAWTMHSLSLARTGKADAGSLRAALALAVDLAGTGNGGP